MKRIFLPQGFKFSLATTVLSVFLAVLMLVASSWQWERYKFKVELLETYKFNDTSAPLDLPERMDVQGAFDNVLHRRVQLTGRYDFEHQVIVKNRQHASGPGSWLLTPLEINNSKKWVIVSRGFIPYKDRTKDSWEKYNTQLSGTIEAVVQSTVPQKTIFSPRNPDVGLDKPFQTEWLYPDIKKMSKQLPYPVVTPIFLQQLHRHSDLVGENSFPAESITVRVPPSTHFGYTIEWILLALVTLVIGFLLQAFGNRRSRPRCQPVTINS